MYEKFLSGVIKGLDRVKWDTFVRALASDIALLKDAKNANEILADSMLARGLQVIEDLLDPIAVDAALKNASITATLNDANGAKSQILTMLAELQAGGITADLVSETSARKWLTPALKATYDGYAAALAAKATPQDIIDAIAVLTNGASTALDTFAEIEAKFADEDNAAATFTSALANRLRIDTDAQGLTTLQKSNALINLGLAFATTLQAQAGTDASALMTPATVAAAILALAPKEARVGEVVIDVMGVDPPNCLLADGSLVSRTTFADLATAALPNAVTEAQWSSGYSGRFSVGDGANTIRVPDLRAVFLRGLDGGRGLDSGRAQGTYQADAFKDHTHPYSVSGGAYTYGIGEGPGTVYTGETGANTGGASTGGGPETRPKNVAVRFFIRYK